MKYYSEELYFRQKAGEIKNLVMQPEFVLQPSFTKNGKLYRAIKYRADFSFYDTLTDKLRIIDVKGMKTEKFLIKAKMFEYQFPELSLELV